MSKPISRRLCRSLVLASLVAAAMTVPFPPAFAACHAFTISASPTTVAEGGGVTVTVERDANVNPSAVDVRTVDGSARSGQDFTGGRRTISFTTETSTSYVIPTINDAASENTETFRVELVSGSGTGCAVNSDFRYGPPVTITISASDQAPATSSPSSSPAPPSRSPTPAATGAVKPPATPVTQRPTLAATGSAGGTPIATRSALVTPFQEPTGNGSSTPLASQPSGDNEGLPTSTIVIAVILLITVLAAGAAFLYRARRLRG